MAEAFTTPISVIPCFGNQNEMFNTWFCNCSLHIHLSVPKKDEMVLPSMRPGCWSGLGFFFFLFWFVAIFPTCFRVFIQNASNHRRGGFRTLGDVKRPNPICTVNKALGVTSDVKLQWKFFFYCLHLSNKLFKNYKRAFFFYFNSHFICIL